MSTIKILSQIAQMLLRRNNLNQQIIAGGTDIIPNLKNRLYDVDRLINISKIPELNTIELAKDFLAMGATTKIAEVALNKNIKKNYFALHLAANNIASPQIRNVATVGGNICLDTRCLYFNQSSFWRE